jgi:hypothetical protein
MLRKITLLLLLFSSSINLQASHLVGGDITWECAGNGQYIFQLTLYRDCNGASLPTGSQWITGPAGSIICAFDPSSSGIIANYPNSANCLLEKGVYRSAPISLLGTPNPNGFEFSWTTCCRPSLENSNASIIHLRSKMYPYSAPGNSSPNTINTCYDSSPKFLNDLAFIQFNGKFNYNLQAVDPDQDSISISFARPWSTSSSPISFNGGYSFSAPFPDSSENALNGPNTIDPWSGILSLESYNASAGFYANCVVVRSYRNGQLIAEVYRELPLYIDQSSTGLANNPPQLEIDTAVYTKVRRFGNTYRLTAMNNDSIDLLIKVSDLNVNNNGSFQNFCLTANGTKINPNNLLADTNCIGGGPCATIDTLASGGYCGNVMESFRFKWLAQCSLLSQGLQGRTSYLFHIMATDDDSAASKSGNLTLIVDLFPSQTNAPNFSISGGNTNGDIDFSWTKNNAQADSPFGKYQIYGNAGAGTPFLLLDTITDLPTTTLSLNGLNFPAEFYMNKITGSCRATSNNSDTISSIILSESELSSSKLSLYPQPAKDFLILESTESSQNMESAELYDLRGKRIQQFDLDPNARQQKLMLKHAAGMYILDIKVGDEQVRKRIVIK